MKNPLTIFIILLLIPGFLSAQKAPLDNTVYDSWRSLSSQVISEDGKWITYTINTQQGDGCLYIYNVTSARKDSVARGMRAVFSPDQLYLAYNVIPSYSELRQAKKKKLKEDKMPKSNLEIRLLAGDDVIKVLNVKSFAVAENNSNWMVYLLEKKTGGKKLIGTAGDTSKISGSDFLKKSKSTEPKGAEFVIFNPVSKKEYKYQDVTEYCVAVDGKTISFLQIIPDTSKTEKCIVNVFDTKKEILGTLFPFIDSSRLGLDGQG